MKVSIVISTYNRLDLLKRALESALSQTISCEVIVADDCSTDGTEAYLQSLGDRIIYHRNPKNSGHAATVNAGVQRATGDWIKFVDDDDYLAPHCVEMMLKAIALRPEAVICSCQAAQVDAEGTELYQTSKVGLDEAFYIPQDEIHYGMLLEKVPFGTPIQVACSRAAFLKSGGWDSQLDANCDDIDSWVRIAQFGDAIFLNQCLAYRTVWPGAYNRKFSLQKRLETNLLIKEKIYHLAQKHKTHPLPSLEAIASYLKLHWGAVAIKQGQLLTALNFILPNLFSLKAWYLLFNALWTRYTPALILGIWSNLIPSLGMYRKLPLIESAE